MALFRRPFIVPSILAVFVCLATANLAWGSPSYERMAPLNQYLISDRQAEITLAQSAAPPSIAGHATVMALGSRGYTAVIQGTNGFTCLVERSWMSPFSSSEFWNWHMRGPICYNAAASHSVLLYTINRTQMVLARVSKSAMLSRIRTAVANNALPTPAPGSMAFMLSKRGYIGDGNGAWMPHLMLYAPASATANNGASWGANLPGSPVFFDSVHHVVPEPETIFYIPVAHWSNGTDAPKM